MGAAAGESADEPESVRGCSCGMADYGAPGHDGDDDGRDDDGRDDDGENG